LIGSKIHANHKALHFDCGGAWLEVAMGKRGRDTAQPESSDPAEGELKAKKVPEAHDSQDASVIDRSGAASSEGGGMYPRSELRHPPATSGQFIKIITWNVAGLRGTLKKSPKILEQLAAVRVAINSCVEGYYI
jgi:hypothetical protein